MLPDVSITKIIYSESTAIPPTSPESLLKSRPRRRCISSVSVCFALASSAVCSSISRSASPSDIAFPNVSSSCLSSSFIASIAASLSVAVALSLANSSLISPLISNSACSRASIRSDKSTSLFSSKIGSSGRVSMSNNITAPKPQQITSRKEMLNSSIPLRLIMSWHS